MTSFRSGRLSEKDFFQIRRRVLSSWPTGAGVDLWEAVAYHKSLPAEKNFALTLERRPAHGTYVQPRAGVPVLAEQIELLTYLAEEGQADMLPTTIDSYTRHNRYDEAQKGLEKSIADGKAYLNGFPAVNYGVEGCRKLTEALPRPLQVRHGTPDARLLAEITLAGGFTSFEGGGISYNLPYCKNIRPELTIEWWQYVDRLVGWYQEQGITINREPFGPLTGTLVPPFISHGVNILEALLAAEQGVKSISVGYAVCGNIIQDVAAIISLEALTREYLTVYGYDDVSVTTVLHQWMGAFPQDSDQANAIIAQGAATAGLAGARRMITKTVHEAFGVPSREANAAGLKLSKMMVKLWQGQGLGQQLKLEQEIDLITRETKAIIDRILELGEGNVGAGAVRAIDSGVIDVPFAPSVYNKGEVMPARDLRGAVRLLNSGNLPLPADIKEFHREALAERRAVTGEKEDFELILADINSMVTGNIAFSE
ncbi:MAG: methylaspartate mutase subunit E [bacterium]|jgi:methylaspartate mutase epsilon subunit